MKLQPVSHNLILFQRAGTAHPSVVAKLLEDAIAEGKLTPQHEDDIKGIAGAILAGARIRSFFLRVGTEMLERAYSWVRYGE